MRRQSGEEEEGVNLTPMLDVVFIMLIFFVVTASFVKETGLDVEKPRAHTAERQELASILIGISAGGEIWLEGRRVELGALRAVVARMFAENPRASVSIQADERSPARFLVMAVEEARAAGVEDVAVSTLEP